MSRWDTYPPPSGRELCTIHGFIQEKDVLRVISTVAATDYKIILSVIMNQRRSMLNKSRTRSGSVRLVERVSAQMPVIVQLHSPDNASFSISILGWSN